MNILAIETSTKDASLCLMKKGSICAASAWQAERNHDSFLFPALEKALLCLDDESLDLILVGAGPGSYGGVRVALAAAVGVATVKASHVVSICSWWGLTPQDTCMVSDAKRGGWTVLRPGGDITVLTTDALKEEAGKGLSLVTVETEETLARHGLTAMQYEIKPTAENLIQAWLSLPEEKKEELKAAPAEPIYVRPPHITEAKRKPWQI